jgi:hypothetical protein
MTLATKPVATLGTSRARAAVSASAQSAVVLARMMRFRRFTGASGKTRQCVAGQDVGGVGEGSLDLEIALAETSRPLADSEIL